MAIHSIIVKWLDFNKQGSKQRKPQDPQENNTKALQRKKEIKGRGEERGGEKEN